MALLVWVKSLVEGVHGATLVELLAWAGIHSGFGRKHEDMVLTMAILVYSFWPVHSFCQG